MPRLGDVWSVLREPLCSFSFSTMKEIASASGLATVELSRFRQSSSSRSTTKSELADGIDTLFNSLNPDDRDRVTGNVITELVDRLDDEHTERLEVLLERVGWHLVAGEPAPLSLRLDTPVESLPEIAVKAISKATRRFRDGDFDGAMTSIAGTIDSLTEEIYNSAGITNHKSSSYQQRAIKAHRELESNFRARLAGMSTNEADLVWKGRERAVNGAADVLGAFRRNYSDAHGAGSADPRLVQDALQAATFLITCLTT